MRIALAGGNGFIGRELTRRLISAGQEVVWLSHRPGRAEGLSPDSRPTAEVAFDPGDPEGPWVAEVGAADAVGNLSGFPISARWTPETKGLILTSRIQSTKAIVEAIARARSAGRGPGVLVNASACGYYGERGDETLTEGLAPGDDWLAQVCARWEEEARRGEEAGARVVRIRTGIVMGDEGALPRMVSAFHLFAGGPIGTGRQWFPWVHHADIVGIYVHALADESVTGALNGGSPNPLRMSDFAKVLGKVLNRPSWAPVPRFALRLALGEAADSTLMSQRMSAGKALETGYVFRFPQAEEALRDVLGK